MKRIELVALDGIGLVAPGDDLVGLVAAALESSGYAPRAGDVLVVTQKIVSKAEDRYADLGAVEPGAEARRLADALDKDPRVIQVVLDESADVVRYGHGVLVTEHSSGHVLANAGIDRSNIECATARVLRLPADPDRSAEALHAGLSARFGAPVAVVVSDSAGRAWRHGVIGMAVGAAGLPALIDARGDPDLFGAELRVTQIGFADEIASAASLLMGEADEGVPVVLVRGLAWSAAPNPARALVRERESDLFR